MVVDPATNELYVADGYFNHRVHVFDAATGAFKRMWGRLRQAADGRKAHLRSEGAARAAVQQPGARRPLTKDGLVFVSDRGNNRAQVFRKDGTFVREYAVLKEGLPGSVWLDDAVARRGAELFHRLRRSERRVPPSSVAATAPSSPMRGGSGPISGSS